MAVASAGEVWGAQAFLRYLGAPWRSRLLTIAVVAWMRQESGSLDRVVGNNPFNIRPGVASKWAIGRRKGPVGYFLVFPDIATGFRAAALLLQTLAPSYGYGRVITAARAGNPVNFLNALAMSSWSGDNYGWPRTNNLLRVYAGFTGMEMPRFEPPSSSRDQGRDRDGEPRPKPKPKKKPKPKPRRKPPPVRPRDFHTPLIIRDYLDPYAAGRFLAERHQDDHILD